MQRREKLLLIALVSVVAVLWGVPMIYRAVMGPLDAVRDQITLADTRLSDKETKAYAVRRAKRLLSAWKYQSLPPNALDAHRLYQQWVTELAQMAGLSKLRVTPERRMPKGKTYTAVEVAVDGEGTLDQVSRFLFHFYRADLLHRLARLELKSPTTEGNPLLAISLTAEGMSLAEAPSRARLFPQTSLAGELSSSGTRLTVAGGDGFPTQPGFRVRIGHEYLTVTAVQGNLWTVARGSDATTAAAHASGDVVELSLVHPEYESRTLADYRALLVQNPFAKPVKYDPKLLLDDQTVVRGNALQVKAQASGIDPAFGAVEFALGGSVPEGMTIDPRTGELTWSPTVSLPAGEYPVTITARQPGAGGATLTQTVKVQLREPNLPPTIAEVPPQSAFLGSTLGIRMTAEDSDSPAESLKFSLSGTVPAGATIDAATGELRWTPPDSQEPGTYDLTVTVTDAGTPPQSASRTVKVTLAEDTARDTYLIAAIDQDDEREAWLYDRAANRKFTLHEGETFAVANIQGRVLAIGRDFILFESGEESWRLELGQSLRERVPVEAGERSSSSRG